MRSLSGLRDWIDGHKKATAAIIAALVNLVPDRYVAADQKDALTKLAIAFVVGQGAADFGKERAKVEVAAGELARSAPSERRTPRDMPVAGG